ncbi:LysM peptidoglycan-binding domain-containing protein [Nonomuraea jiangxiensis]|uniref:LysM domain-containing protein n=1 Tax=Nonomuraea jiangxiensis TaxID=633440 RepID=A0A1G9EX24_9ACTN|nr:LysM peptidoglycan-binding domain-containing protein [Nonomuraea jiangxiensis]SDK80660.1 LysM domain-containing protein [Nonomuraea jiangxiensis]
MPLERLTITPLDATGRPQAGRRVKVRYNPEEFTVSKDNAFAVQGVPGLGSPIVQFVSGNQRTLEIELFFDTYDNEQLPKTDVRTETGQVAAFMELDSDLHAPPVVEVAMAAWSFRGVLTRASQRYILFMPDGTPVRARMSCTFIEYVDQEQAARAANLQTADYSKQHVVAGDETLSSIAARLYGDAAKWRPIALANGLADPREIAPGDALHVPALPYVNPVTWEVEE